MDIVMAMSTLDLSSSPNHVLMGLLKLYAYFTSLLFKRKPTLVFGLASGSPTLLSFCRTAYPFFSGSFPPGLPFVVWVLPKCLLQGFPFQICLYAPFHFNTWPSHLKRSLLKRLLYEGFSQILELSPSCIGARTFLSIQCLYLQML